MCYRNDSTLIRRCSDHRRIELLLEPCGSHDPERMIQQMTLPAFHKPFKSPVGFLAFIFIEPCWSHRKHVSIQDRPIRVACSPTLKHYSHFFFLPFIFILAFAALDTVFFLTGSSTASSFSTALASRFLPSACHLRTSPVLSAKSVSPPAGGMTSFFFRPPPFFPPDVVGFRFGRHDIFLMSLRPTVSAPPGNCACNFEAARYRALLVV